jgi:hypothetical protein
LGRALAALGTSIDDRSIRDVHGVERSGSIIALVIVVKCESKVIDPRECVVAGLQSLEGTITRRTETQVAHHLDTLAY